ncbi:MAG: M20/M25/M40 family metallo-hydrolase [Firmicutes bacterium]|nr:M20/M25/M40 family metallo-hydrolase [Bacillota bacterium]
MSEILEKIVSYGQEHKAEFLEVLKNVVNYESYCYGEREVKNKCGLYLEQLFQELGFETWHFDVGEVGIHICGKYGTGEKKIFLLGHYDTVFPTGTTETRPFTMDEEKAYGPGIFDMKGGLVGFYMAVKALKELDIYPEGTQLTFFFSCDEEGGSVTSRARIEEMAKEADVTLVTEPGHKGEGYITIGRYGRDVVKVKAIGTAEHAGHHPKCNPNLEIARIAKYISEECSDGEDLWASIVSIHGGDLEAMAATPAEAYLITDIRYATEAGGEKAAQVIRDIKPTIEGMKIEITGGVEKPALKQGPYSQFAVDRTIAIIEEMGYEYKPKVLGGGSDGNFTSGINCPTIDGLGLNGEFLHNPREYVFTSTIPQRVALIAELIRTL